MSLLNRTPTALYFAAGLFCGLLLGPTIDKTWAGILVRFLSGMTVVVVALFWHRIESSAHKRHMETWPIRRVRGKWRFVLTRYVFFRGTLLFLATIAPSFASFKFSSMVPIVVFAAYVGSSLIFLYLGHEEWTRCEEEYEIKALRLAAEQTRFAKAFEN